MALIERYVDPSATGSNNGTSWANAYTSLATWNTNEAVDLVTATNTHTVHCRGGADVVANATTISMSGWTTSATYFVTIQVDNADLPTVGKVDTAKYYLSKTSAAATPTDVLQPAAYTRLIGLQFYFRINTGSNAPRACVNIVSGKNGCLIEKCRFDIGGTNATFAPYAITIDAATSGAGNQVIRNNIFIESSTGNYPVISNSLGAATDRVKIYNNTFIGTKTAIALASATGIKAINNIFQGFTNDSTAGTGSFESGTDYNLTSKTSFAAGSNNVVSTTLTFAGSGSYYLNASDTATNAGTDLSGTFTADITGATRTAPWSIGAFELTATGLTISSVTPSSFDDGRTGIVIAGSGFGASQGSSTLTIGAQAQTVTAWNDTSITFTSVRGNQATGSATLAVDDGTNSDTSAVSWNTWRIRPATMLRSQRATMSGS